MHGTISTPMASRGTKQAEDDTIENSVGLSLPLGSGTEVERDFGLASPSGHEMRKEQRQQHH